MIVCKPKLCCNGTTIELRSDRKPLLVCYDDSDDNIVLTGPTDLELYKDNIIRRRKTWCWKVREYYNHDPISVPPPFCGEHSLLSDENIEYHGGAGGCFECDIDVNYCWTTQFFATENIITWVGVLPYVVIDLFAHNQGGGPYGTVGDVDTPGVTKSITFNDKFGSMVLYCEKRYPFPVSIQKLVGSECSLPAIFDTTGHLLPATLAAEVCWIIDGDSPSPQVDLY